MTLPVTTPERVFLRVVRVEPADHLNWTRVARMRTAEVLASSATVGGAVWLFLRHVPPPVSYVPPDPLPEWVGVEPTVTDASGRCRSYSTTYTASVAEIEADAEWVDAGWVAHHSGRGQDRVATSRPVPIGGGQCVIYSTGRRRGT